MSRVRQSQIHLAPLLDVVFIVLLLYVASLVGRGQVEERQRAENQRLLDVERQSLREVSRDERRDLFDAVARFREEESRRRRAEEALEAHKIDLERASGELRDLARQAGAQEDLLAEIEKRFGERAAQTAILLATVERHFDIYEVTFHTDGRLRLITPKKEIAEWFPTSAERAVEAIAGALPARFEPSRAVFLVRRDPESSTILIKKDFYPLAREKGWILNDTLVDIDEDG